MWPAQQGVLEGIIQLVGKAGAPPPLTPGCVAAQALPAERHPPRAAGLGGGRQLAAVRGRHARLRVWLLARQPGVW